MARINALFSKPTSYDHPRLRSWRAWKQNPSTKKCYIEFRRERDGLTFKPATIHFTAEQSDGTKHRDSENWDEAFNDALIERGFKARSPKNEGERFGYMLVARMQPLAGKFGDGFFNAVLIPYLKENEYDQHHVGIYGKLASIHTNAPYRSEHVDDCKERIDSVLARCASQLTNALAYPSNEGQEVLLDAVDYYLDERFSITSRKMLGW